MNCSLFLCLFSVQLILLSFATAETKDDQLNRKKRNTDVDVLGLVNIHAPSRKNVNVDVGGEERDDRKDQLVTVNVQGHRKNANVAVGGHYEGKGAKYETDGERAVNVDVRVPKVKVDVDRDEDGRPKKKRVHLKVLDKLRKYDSEESDERGRHHVVKIERERDGGRLHKTVYIEREH